MERQASEGERQLPGKAGHHYYACWSFECSSRNLITSTRKMLFTRCMLGLDDGFVFLLVHG